MAMYAQERKLFHPARRALPYSCLKEAKKWRLFCRQGYFFFLYGISIELEICNAQKRSHLLCCNCDMLFCILGGMVSTLCKVGQR